MSKGIISPAEEKKELSRKLIDKMFLDAFTDKASEIHLEPLRDGMMVKYRAGGDIKDVKLLSPSISDEVLLTLKTMAGMNIEAVDTMQKGNIVVSPPEIEGEQSFNMIVGTIPTIYGERVTLRINTFEVEVEIVKRGFEALSFKGEDLLFAKEIFDKAFGLVIITGSSGSGKTSTCHCALRYIKNRTEGKANIIALEDWFVSPLEGISQVIVQQDKEGHGFYETLRAVAWQSPDVIFVASVPDKNTARKISELAVTGHMVIVQMPSPDVFQAIEELCSLGMEPYLLASALEGALAQRLVRRICENCKEEYKPSQEIREKYFQKFSNNSEDLKLYRARGCKECRNSGYKGGRAGVYEIVIPDMELKELIAGRVSTCILKEAMEKKGFMTLREKALSCALSGITTLEEALRVSYT